DDGWAAFALAARSYAWLDEAAKRARFLALLGALEALGADLQILRVGGRFEVDRYARELEREHKRTSNGENPIHTKARRRYLEEHEHRLTELAATRPAVFLLVSLRDPERDVASYVSKAAEQRPREWVGAIKRALAVGDSGTLKVSELEQARIRAD